MDALWSLEDRLRLSTREVAAFLACSVVLVIGVCIAIFRVGRKGRNRVVADVSGDGEAESRESDYCSSCDRELLVKDVLSDSARWSRARRWDEICRGVFERLWWRRGGPGERISTRWKLETHRRAPVWQRPILMGEKCELPRFSGLILYDENGHPTTSSTPAG